MINEHQILIILISKIIAYLLEIFEYNSENSKYAVLVIRTMVIELNGFIRSFILLYYYLLLSSYYIHTLTHTDCCRRHDGLAHTITP